MASRLSKTFMADANKWSCEGFMSATRHVKQVLCGMNFKLAQPRKLPCRAAGKIQALCRYNDSQDPALLTDAERDENNCQVHAGVNRYEADRVFPHHRGAVVLAGRTGAVGCGSSGGRRGS